MKRSLNITVLMDAACIPAEDPEFLLQDPKEVTTEYHVVGALRRLGHAVSILGVAHSVPDMLAPLVEKKPDLVFNLTEVFREKRRFDSNIAALLELMEIPFTGTGSTGLMLCRDKGLSKQLLSLHRIRVPGFASFPPGRPPAVPKLLRYPMVVKPAYADGSEGISNASLVSGEEALVERVRMVHERWQQPAIAEEYIEGRELYVGVVGNRRLSVFPPRELFLNQAEGQGPVLATYRVKWDEQYQEKWHIRFGFADLDETVLPRIARTCRNVFHILQLRDYARIDLRLTPENRLVILEVNPNPDIAYGEEVAEAAEKVGISYERLIARIVRHALRRYGNGARRS